MPTTLEPAAPPPDVTDLVERAARVSLLPVSPRQPQRIALELEEAPWTTAEAKKHPRWPEHTPGGLGGKFMKVGQIFHLDGHDWEIEHVIGTKVIAAEASGDYKKAETREFDTTDTPGPEDVLTGAERPKAKLPKGGKSKPGGELSTVTVVDPYNDPNSHDPAIPIPENSSITPEEWQKFGRLEQLHYLDLQTRFGQFKPSGAKALIEQAYSEFDGEIQNLVSQSYSEQYGSSTGFTLSITGFLHNLLTSADAKEKARAKREKAKELQMKIRDAYAWDLYNRTHSPDVVIVHKDKFNNGTHWWESNFIHGDRPIFSGLSHSHVFDRNFWSSQTGVAHAVSIRHIVMSTWIGAPTQGKGKQMVSEREMAVSEQMRVDPEHAISFQNNEVPSEYLTWLEGNTQKQPAPGDVFRAFKAAMQGGEPLPVPPPLPEVDIEGGKEWLPPPDSAADAMKEYADKLPDGGSGHWSGTTADLAKFDLPWADLDANGNPVAKEASESGYVVGDYMMGLGGTLYWIGPDPSHTNALGLRMHKLAPDGKGGLRFVEGKTYPLEDGKPDYKLKGNSPPPPIETKEGGFEKEAWVKSAAEPIPIASMQVGDKFTIDGADYEIIQQPGAVKTVIRDLETDKQGTVNSLYSPVMLEPAEGYVPGGALKPSKGLTFSRDGEKHTITYVSKSGVVSAKPQKAGSTVIKLDPEDPSLSALFDPEAWKKGTTEKVGTLALGDLFDGGKGKRHRPYKVVSGEEEGFVYWENLDTGKHGKSKPGKKVVTLVPTDDSLGPGATPPPTPGTHEALQAGDQVTIGQLKPGDWLLDHGHIYSVANPGGHEVLPTVQALHDDGSWTKEPIDFADPTTKVTLYAKAADTPATQQHGEHDPFPPPPGFDPYGSAYGTGGKVKHDKLKLLPKGTVFVDKNGVEYLVREPGATPTITDGVVNYTVDGELRGKAAHDAEWTKGMPPIEFDPVPPPPEPPPAPPPPSDPGLPSVGDLVDNKEGLSVQALGIGSLYTFGDVTLRKISDTHREEVDGETAGTVSEILSPEGIPTLIALPGAAKPPTQAALKPNSEDWTVAELPPGSLFEFGGIGGSGHIVAKVTEDHFIIAKPAPGALLKAGEPVDIAAISNQGLGFKPESIALASGFEGSKPSGPDLSGFEDNVNDLAFSELPLGTQFTGTSGKAIMEKTGPGTYTQITTTNEPGMYEVGTVHDSSPSWVAGKVKLPTPPPGKTTLTLEPGDTAIITAASSQYQGQQVTVKTIAEEPVDVSGETLYHVQWTDADGYEHNPYFSADELEKVRVKPQQAWIEMKGQLVDNQASLTYTQLPEGSKFTTPEKNVIGEKLPGGKIKTINAQGWIGFDSNIGPGYTPDKISLPPSVPGQETLMDLEDGEHYNLGETTIEKIGEATEGAIVKNVDTGEIHTLDSTTTKSDAVKQVAALVPAPGKGLGLTPNEKPMITVDQMPVGTYYGGGTAVFQKTGEDHFAQVNGDGSLTPEKTLQVGGKMNTPGLIKFPDADPMPEEPTGALAALEPNDAGLTWKQLPIGSLFGGEDAVGRKSSRDEYEILGFKNVTVPMPDADETAQKTMPPKVLLPAVPEPSAPIHLHKPIHLHNLDELNQGDEFENEDGTPLKVIAKAADGVVVKDMVSGKMGKLNGGVYPGSVDLDAPGYEPVAPVVEMKVVSPPEPSTMPTLGDTGQSIDQLLQDLHLMHPEGFSTEAIPSYASGWGSGGTYKHDRLNELEPGTAFVVKGSATIKWYVLRNGTEGTLIWRPIDGEVRVVDGKTRVRKV